jgi:hypothetical protein
VGSGRALDLIRELDSAILWASNRSKTRREHESRREEVLCSEDERKGKGTFIRHDYEMMVV